MTFARRNRLKKHFSERIPVVKRRMTVQSRNSFSDSGFKVQTLETGH